MKKFFIFILILISLIGTFSIQVSAAGWCVYTTDTNNWKKGDPVIPAITKPECDQNFLYMTWDPNATVQPTLTLQCADGSDNDGDNAIDTNDPGCHTDGDATNSGTYKPTDNSETNTSSPTDPKYKLLAPITTSNGDGTGVFFDQGELNSQGKNIALSKYLNTMIRIFIGLCAVLAVIMIVMGGIEYMTSELVSSKEAGKSRITEALLGLLIALGSYALLNTINPDLLKLDVDIPETEINYADAVNFEKTELTTGVGGTGFKVNGNPSAGVSAFVNRLANGEQLREIVVDTGAKRAYFYVGPAGDWTQSVSVPINIGRGGVAPAGTAAPGDLKTPIGTSYIGGKNVVASNMVAITASANGKIFNVGAAFIDTGIPGRGIGFHGSANNALGTTNACIRMYNDDLLALGKYMRNGIKVTIK